MDAVKYLRERERICDMYECGDCPLFEMDCDGVRHIEESVALVEKWSKENPIKTRADVFKEMFPGISIDENGQIDLMPCKIEEVKRCTDCELYSKNAEQRSASRCIDKYWNAPAPADFGKGGSYEK